MSEPNLFDRLLGKRLQQTRRDLRALTSAIQGDKPLPYTLKTGDAWPLIEPKPLKQKSLGDEVDLVARRMLTDDSVELTLAFPDHRPLDAAPGQFITLETSIDGQMIRRPYSLSQVDDAKGEFKVAVRLVDGGLMSTHLVQNETSPTLTMLGPSGDFGLAGISHKPKRALLIAAGSGVTPIRSMVEPLLARAKSVKVDIFLLNKDPQSTMYRAELEKLAATHPKRLTLTHWYSRHGKNAGRLTREAFEHYLEKTYKKASPDLIALCGPDAIQDLICTPLASRFPDATLSLETFTPAGSAGPSARLGVQSTIEIVTPTTTGTLIIEGDQTILDASLEAGIDLPFSCTVGGCGACIAKCTSGRVSMPALNALSEAEREEGMILTCVAQARGPATIEVIA